MKKAEKNKNSLQPIPPVLNNIRKSVSQTKAGSAFLLSKSNRFLFSSQTLSSRKTDKPGIPTLCRQR
jgi:hypothetical protein